jgi:archaellum biogenesis ATPase FlaH|tara:strand:- start:216 stop:548 length:333 start_codon:yes stop_codon:yes gene_type:complete
MTESYKKGHFNNLSKKLSEALKYGIRIATSEGQIERVTELIRAKDRAVKQSAAIYAKIKNTNKIKDKDFPFQIIIDSTDEIMKAPDEHTIQSIQILRDTKIKGFLKIIRE